MTARILLYWTWIETHGPQAAALAGIALGVLEAARRAVPAAMWRTWETRYPRLCAGLRIAGALGCNFAKAVRLGYTVLTGRPWPLPEVVAVAIEAGKEGESQR